MSCADNCTNCDYASSCMGGCISCSTAGTCTDTCSGTCMWTCSGTCSGGCQNGCEGGCSSCSANSSCKGTCSSCYSLASCKGGCATCEADGSCTLGCIGCSSAGSCMGESYASRPANFTGFIGVISGAGTNKLTAIDWNDFLGRIGMFALYKSKGNEIINISGVVAGDDITATKVNQARNNLNVLSSYISTSIPSIVNSGDTIYASYFQALKSALNSIQ